MLRRYAAVALDLDGTLLDRGRISDANLACITQLEARGIAVIIATGRPIEFLRAASWARAISGPAIVLGGSVTYSSIFGVLSNAATIPRGQLTRLMASCRMIAEIERIIFDGIGELYATRETDERDIFAAMYGAECHLLDLDDLPSARIVSVMLRVRAHRRTVVRQLEAQFGRDFHFTCFEGEPYIKVACAGAHKGTAVRAVCEQRGLQCDELIALGDGVNDVEMLACAGLAIAMSNGEACVKAIAHRVVPNHHGEGVASALREIFHGLP